MKTLLVTGAGGLIGSEVVAAFARDGWRVLGVDNNLRADFFGPQGDTTWNLRRLREAHPGFDCRSDGSAGSPNPPARSETAPCLKPRVGG